MIDWNPFRQWKHVSAQRISLMLPLASEDTAFGLLHKSLFCVQFDSWDFRKGIDDSESGGNRNVHCVSDD